MRYTMKDVKTTCNKILSDAFPGVPVYGNDTHDGYKRPSFFTEIASTGHSKESTEITRHGYRFRITFFENQHDEAACLDIYHAICNAFEPRIRVNGERKCTLFTESIEVAWAGEYGDMMQIAINFSNSIEVAAPKEDGDLINTVTTKIKTT